MIDDKDLEILAILQENARTSNAEIARRVGLAASAVFERVRKLEERGVIRGYAALVDPLALDLPLTAFVYVKTNERVSEHTTADRIGNLPGVQEVHHIAGEDCYVVKVRTKSPQDLGRWLRERLGEISTVTSTRTTIVLGTMKETAALPIAEALSESARVRKAS